MNYSWIYANGLTKMMLNTSFISTLFARPIFIQPWNEDWKSWATIADVDNDPDIEQHFKEKKSIDLYYKFGDPWETLVYSKQEELIWDFSYPKEPKINLVKRIIGYPFGLWSDTLVAYARTNAVVYYDLDGDIIFIQGLPLLATVTTTKGKTGRLRVQINNSPLMRIEMI